MMQLGINTQPYDLAIATDGTPWVTLSNISAVKPIGSKYYLYDGRIGPNDSAPEFIIAGGDGRLWFSNRWGAFIGAVDANGAVQAYPFDASNPWSSRESIGGFVKGPDGDVWFAGSESLGKITARGVVTHFKDAYGATAILAGRDGYVWVAQQDGHIARVSSSGEVKQFELPLKGSHAVKLAQDTKGTVWFLDERSEIVGRIDATGQITQERLERSVVPGTLSDIATTPDGLIWFATTGPNRIIAFDGDRSYIGPYTTKSQPGHFFVARDGTLWFTEEKINVVGYIRHNKLTEISLPKTSKH
jgi:virginiamycin B lyase